MSKSEKRNTSRKLRRAKSELKYFINLLNDMREESDNYNIEWYSDFNFIVKELDLCDRDKKDLEYKHLEKITNKKIKIESIEAIEEKIINNEKPDWAKKLYRKIAKTSHPDKTIDTYNSKKMNDIFQKASTAFNKEDFNVLIEIAIDLEIQVEISNRDLLEKVNKRIKSAKKDIADIENSPYWLWGESLGMDDLRLTLLEKILSNKFSTKVKREKILNALGVLNNT